MPFYFDPFPTVNYDLNGDGNTQLAQNLLVRFRLQAVVESKTVLYYQYTIKENEKPDSIAAKYYDDPTLSWIILLTNNVTNPLFDWPLDYRSFVNFIKGKYGSVALAQAEVQRYEKIISTATTNQGIVIPERTLTVDQTTYDSLAPAERRIVYAYDYEVELNDDKRNIKILDRKYLPGILASVEDVFS